MLFYVKIYSKKKRVSYSNLDQTRHETRNEYWYSTTLLNWNNEWWLVELWRVKEINGVKLPSNVLIGRHHLTYVH